MITFLVSAMLLAIPAPVQDSLQSTQNRGKSKQEPVTFSDSIGPILKENCSPAILAPDRINQYAKALAENLGIKYSHNESPEFYDAIIFVEFNSYDMLGSFAQKARDFSGPKMLIDHHLGSLLSHHYSVGPSQTSTGASNDTHLVL